MKVVLRVTKDNAMICVEDHCYFNLHDFLKVYVNVLLSTDVTFVFEYDNQPSDDFSFRVHIYNRDTCYVDFRDEARFCDMYCADNADNFVDYFKAAVIKLRTWFTLVQVFEVELDLD